ncbi:MAG: BrnA antitoxin family protein [Deltaproteobacteria bacterium]|nr:BrnA antitoxin family protein [Deltaproteobacteria bacterium]
MKREYDLSKGKRGPVIPLPPEKVRITIRLDQDIVDHFRDRVRKAHRGNYQTLINDALREYLQRPTIAQQVGAEVRLVLREELGKVKVSA